MKRILELSLIGILFVSCASTTWVEKDYENQKGVIKYSAQGGSYFTNKNNKQALEEISNFCKGNYAISKEATLPEYKGKFFSENGKSQSASNKDGKKSEKTYQSSSSETENFEDIVYVYFKCN